MRETWLQSLGREDPLEKEMATHSSILAWRIPWMEEPGRLQSMGSQRVGHDWATSLFSVMFASLLRNFNTYLVKIPRPIMSPGLYLFRFSFLHEAPWLQGLRPFLEENLRCMLKSCLLCNKGIKTPVSPLIDVAGSNKVSQCIRNPGKSNEEVVSIVLIWKFGGKFGIASN